MILVMLIGLGTKNYVFRQTAAREASAQADA